MCLLNNSNQKIYPSYLHFTGTFYGLKLLLIKFTDVHSKNVYITEKNTDKSDLFV